LKQVAVPARSEVSDDNRNSARVLGNRQPVVHIGVKGSPRVSVELDEYELVLARDCPHETKTLVEGNIEVQRASNLPGDVQLRDLGNALAQHASLPEGNGFADTGALVA